MTTRSTRSEPTVLAHLAHRWPTVVGLLAAVAMYLTSTDPVSIALVVAIAATCYVAAAVFALPWMAWAWIPLSFVVVVLGHLVGLDPVTATATAAAVLVQGDAQSRFRRSWHQVTPP